MLAAIFSDVHANLPALERFVALTLQTVDAYVCLGDVVNYGPWNDECLELVHSLPGVVLLEGNHERLFLGTEPIEHEIPLVRSFFAHSLAFFSRRDLILDLHRDYELGTYLCTHTIGDLRIYPDTQIKVERDHFVGHTHHQFRIGSPGRSIVNCGSVGQNRAFIDLLCYALYDTLSTVLPRILPKQETGKLTVAELPLRAWFIAHP
jgi:diadenosine tetraphosphatase ApaH/serine/threonine PP2A family protein phosphatase